MTKKVKKKIKFKIVPILVFLVVSVLLYFGISFLIETKIKNIYVNGNKILSDQEIIELAKVDEYPSFYKTLSSTIKKNIKKSPYIKSVKIKKKFFNVLEINVVEYIPLFVKDNKLVLENSKSVDIVNCKVPVFSNNAEQETIDELIGALLKTKDNIRRQISEIFYSPTEYDKTRFLLFMDDGNYVYINIGKFDKLNYYDEIYPTLNNKKGTLYLDSGNHFEIFK